MKLKGNILAYLNDPFRKSFFKTFYELFNCLINEKELPNYYFTHLLFKKNINNYLNYIGHKKLIQIKREVFEQNDILEDKILFQRFIQENNIPGPTYLGHIRNQHLTINNSSEEIISPTLLVTLLKKLIECCTTSNTLFIKPLIGIGGIGAYKVTLESLSDSNYIKSMFHSFKKNDFIIQESVFQHEIMNKLNSSSLNTIRIISFRGSNGQVGIASTLSRMGCGGAHVDNASSGGIFVPINQEKGQLEKYGYNFITNGGGSFIAHPDSGIIFERFELPYYKQSLELVCHAAAFFKNKIIGWDVAITNTGPILIEGNYNPHLIGTQTACGGFKSHTIYKDLFKKYL